MQIGPSQTDLMSCKRKPPGPPPGPPLPLSESEDEDHVSDIDDGWLTLLLSNCTSLAEADFAVVKMH